MISQVVIFYRLLHLDGFVVLAIFGISMFLLLGFVCALLGGESVESCSDIGVCCCCLSCLSLTTILVVVLVRFSIVMVPVVVVVGGTVVGLGALLMSYSCY